MSKKLLNICPSCGEKLIISTLKCNNCGIEINGDFEIPNEDNHLDYGLPTNDFEFIKLFLKYEGNISKLQDELNMTYQTIKNRIKEINVKIGNEIEMDLIDKNIDFKNDSIGDASKEIIKLLKSNDGFAYCEMLKGDPIKIWLTKDGVKNSGYPALLCEWEIFDAIFKKAKELGGIMYRGDSATQNGAKIGSEELPLDTIDSFISLNYYGGQVGCTTIRRSTYYAAILSWAGLCLNKRSKGKGGYIELINK